MRMMMRMRMSMSMMSLMMKKSLDMKQMLKKMEKKNMKKAVKMIKISFKNKKMTKRTPDYPSKIGNKDKLMLINYYQIRSLLFERQNLKC